MEIFGNFIFLGGGGGYEIANKIQVYKIPNTSDKLPLLKELVHEESTEKAVANYMMTSRDVNPFLIT